MAALISRKREVIICGGVWKKEGRRRLDVANRDGTIRLGTRGHHEALLP